MGNDIYYNAVARKPSGAGADEGLRHKSDVSHHPATTFPSPLFVRAPAHLTLLALPRGQAPRGLAAPSGAGPSGSRPGEPSPPFKPTAAGAPVSALALGEPRDFKHAAPTATTTTSTTMGEPNHPQIEGYAFNAQIEGYPSAPGGVGYMEPVRRDPRGETGLDAFDHQRIEESKDEDFSIKKRNDREYVRLI
jgi:hypothetical protein